MGHADYLWNLLKPMGPYQVLGRYTGGELKCEGQVLDEVQSELNLLERESFLDTAEGPGLEQIEKMLSSRPVARTPEERRLALAALLRIGGDSFTLSAVNDNLRGCGLNAAVSETAEPGLVEVRFPDVPGIPEGFDGLRNIIEEIIPCHLEIRYVYWYITWAMVERRFPVWSLLESKHYTWENLEKQVR